MTKMKSKTRTEKLCAFGDKNPVHVDIIRKHGNKVTVIERRLCEEHLTHQRTKMAEYRQKRKKKGLCARCPNKARTMHDGSASTLCQDCREHVRDLERQRKSRKKGS